MDLVGTAIGAVALGLEVCKGLVKYCRATKGRNKDIEHITRQIQALESTFQALASILPRAALRVGSDQTTIASAITCVEGCEEGIKDLKAFVDSVSDTPGVSDVKGKVKDVSRKLAFGFRQDEVASLLRKVQGLTVTAGNALQTLSLDLCLNNGEHLAGSVTGMTSKLSLVETGIASTSTALLTVIDTAHRDTSTELARFSENMQTRIGALETLVTNQHERTRDYFVSHQFTRVSGTRLLETPAMLREACDIVTSPSSSGPSTPLSSCQWMASSRCNCDFREKTRPVIASSIYIGEAVLSNEYHEASRHFPSCPFYTKSKAQRRVSARFRAGAWSRLSVLVQASLACSTGAGGFSISPQLSFRMIVDRHSPASNEIRKAFAFDREEGLPPDAEMIKMLATAERKILKMFRAGKASPHDQFDDGSNLLHVLMSECSTLTVFGAAGLSDEHVRQLLEFVEELVNAGVPCDEVNISRKAPIHRLITCFWHRKPAPLKYRHMQIELAEALSSLSSGIPVLNNGDDFPLRALEMIMDSPILRHDIGLPPLVIAILGNSGEDVRSILAKHPHSARERTYGMTVLHLSCRWPTVLPILLSTDAAGLIDEICDDMFRQNLTAVDFALYLRCEEGVALLFDAGCSWNKFRDHRPNTGTSIDCVWTVARKLADRRRRLMRLAEETLTEPQLSTVRRGEGVLDSNAAAVVRLLRDAGVYVPTPLAVTDSYATIYLSGNLDITYFPIFFDNGFHDISHPVGGCSTPIQVSNIAKFIDKDRLEPGFFQWLENHGFLDIASADALTLGTNASATGLHILAARLIAEVWYFAPWQYLIFQGFTGAAYLDVFTNRASDGCKCSCSSTGCLPLTTGLKVAIERGIWYGKNPGLHYGDRGWLWEAIGDEVAVELLRFLTFEALEIAHTCCTSTEEEPPDARFLSCRKVYTLREFGGNVEEIQDEEEELHRRLDELLPEFDDRLAEFGGCLKDFVWGYWRKRMAEEFVPVWRDDEVVGGDSGVNFEYNYKTPRRLQALLGRDFAFEGEFSSSERSVVE